MVYYRGWADYTNVSNGLRMEFFQRESQMVLEASWIFLPTSMSLEILGATKKKFIKKAMECHHKS